MDESSRNIVKFIAAGTGAILLLMAAYFYGLDPQPEAMPSPPVAVTQIVQVTDPIVAASPEAEEFAYTDEDAKPIDGQPADTPIVDEYAS